MGTSVQTIVIFRLPPLPPSSQTRCLDERMPHASIHERGREDELLEVILLDPSDAKRRVVMKKQVSLERGSTNELLEVILLDPSDAKRRCLMKKQVSLERGTKKGGESLPGDCGRFQPITADGTV